MALDYRLDKKSKHSSYDSVERYLDLIPLHKGVFSDGGYRFRLNKFVKHESYFYSKGVEEEVYDYVYYNFDTYSM